MFRLSPPPPSPFWFLSPSPQLASKINATLAAKGSPSQSPLISGVQSAIAGKAAAVDMVESYLVGNRTKPDFKNATTLSGLVDYTRGRLRFEASLKQGEFFFCLIFPPRPKGRYLMFDRALSLPPHAGSAFSTAAASSSPSAATNNIVCYVDPVAGTVLNVVQGALGSCTAGGTPVTIPTAGKFVTRIEMAIDKQLPLVGRLNFFVQDTLESKATVYTCGYAGGEAISLFPKGYVVSKLPSEFWGEGERREKQNELHKPLTNTPPPFPLPSSVGCQPLTPAALGRRRLSQVSKLAVNPELVNPIVTSAAEVAAITTGGGAVSPAVDPTGVVQASSFSVPAGSLSAGTLDSIATANSFPTPPVVTPFGNGTNSTSG